MSDVTDYEMNARQSHIDSLAAGDRKDLASMTQDEKLTEILSILRSAEDAAKQAMQNPMIKMSFGL